MSNTRKEAPLPPNGTRNRYVVHYDSPHFPRSQWRWNGCYTLGDARNEATRLQSFYPVVQVVARLADGRKLVIR